MAKSLRTREMSNSEFLRKHAKIGRIGVIGGTTPIDNGIRFAQRHLIPDGSHSRWSHAFIFQGRRLDGRLWVIESDIDIHPGAMPRVGVQENRIEKYFDETMYPNLAVLDLGLQPDDAQKIVSAALDFVSKGTRYAVGGIFKTYWAILRKEMGREAEKSSTFCSSFVRALYQNVGVDLAPGIAVRHTTPEHIASTPAPHTRFELVRE